MFQFGILVFGFLLNSLKSDAHMYNYQNTYQQPQINYQPQTSYQQPSPPCAKFFSYRIDQNKKFAIVTFLNPNRVRNVLKVQMSLGFYVTTVRLKEQLNLRKPD
jgi:hypothetical protein